MSYRWEVLLWLWLAFFFNQADRQVFNVVLPVLGKDLAISSVQLGLVGSIFIATNALLVPVAGFLGDAFSRKRIVVLSLFTWSLATLCTGFGGDLISLVAARGLGTAAGEAFYFPSAVAMLSAEHIGTRARALSLFQTSVYAGLVASGWIGGAMAARWGWRVVFWIFGAAGVALSIPLALRLQDRKIAAPVERVETTASLRAILSTLPRRDSPRSACGAMVFVNVGYLAWSAELSLRAVPFVARRGGILEHVPASPVRLRRCAPRRRNVRPARSGAAAGAARTASVRPDLRRAVSLSPGNGLDADSSLCRSRRIRILSRPCTIPTPTRPSIP